MDTIFDIATDKELVELLGEDTALSKGGEPYTFERQMVQNSQDVNFGLLAQLYTLRGNVKLARQNLEKMRDEQLRRDYMLLLEDLAAIQ